MKLILPIVLFALASSCVPKKEETSKSKAPVSSNSSAAYQKELQKIQDQITKDSQEKLSASELKKLKSEGIISQKDYEKLAQLSE